MKKILIGFLLFLCAGFGFAQTENYSDEKYDLLYYNQDYEEIISSIMQKEESEFSVTDYYYLGISNFMMENDADAQKFLKKAIEKAPEFVKAYDYLAGSYYYSGEFNLAIDNYNKCIELDSEYSKAYKMLGHVYDDAFGDLNTALTYYEKFYELEKNEEANYNMAYILYEMGRYEECIPYCEFYLNYNQNSFSVNEIMILALYTKGDYEAAEKYKEQLRFIWENSDDEYILGQNYFPVLIFSQNGFDATVYEKFDMSGDFYYPLTCVVKSEGKMIRTINLEYDALTDSFGNGYFFGIDEIEPVKMHKTSEAFENFPEFGIFLEYVKKAIGGNVDFMSASY